ncbi:MAG TPA: O-antigen ligase family protein [Ktedonobacterales bacterium]
MPHPPASLILLLIVAALAWIHLEIAIALIPLALPYYLELQPLNASGSIKSSLGEISLLICLGVALLRTLLLAADRRASLEWARGLWAQARLFLPPAMLLLIGAGLALLFSPDRHNSLRAYREEVIEPLLYFLLILRYLRTRTDLARAVSAFLLSALIVAVLGIYQGTIEQSHYFVNATTLRVEGPYGSPNNLGLFLERALPILLAFALLNILRRPPVAAALRRPFWRDPLRWLCLLVSIPLLVAVYLTQSRGAEVGLLVAVVFFFIIEVRQWLAIVGLLVVGAAGGWLLWPRLVQLSEQGHAGTVSERLLYWKAAMLLIRDHFLFGTGPDSFGTLYGPKHPDSYALKALNGQPFPSTYDPGISHPHNMLLDFWISSGLLGLAALLWLLGAFTLVLVRLYRLCGTLIQGDLLQRALLGIAGSMVAMIVHGMVDNFYFLPDLSMVFWLFIGLLLVIGGIAQREGKMPRQDAALPLQEQPSRSTAGPA